MNLAPSIRNTTYAVFPGLSPSPADALPCAEELFSAISGMTQAALNERQQKNVILLRMRAVLLVSPHKSQTAVSAASFSLNFVLITFLGKCD